jgi:hypothetical protein
MKSCDSCRAEASVISGEIAADATHLWTYSEYVLGRIFSAVASPGSGRILGGHFGIGRAAGKSFQGSADATGGLSLHSSIARDLAGVVLNDPPASLRADRLRKLG